MSWLGLAVAGGVGALLRAEASRRLGPVRGTAVVNLLGAALLGLLVGMAGAGRVSTDVVRIVGTGLAGGLTTFSTWMLETSRRRRDLVVGSLVAPLVAGVVVAGIARWLGGS